MVLKRMGGEINELVLNDLLYMHQSQIMEQGIGWVEKVKIEERSVMGGDGTRRAGYGEEAFICCAQQIRRAKNQENYTVESC